MIPAKIEEPDPESTEDCPGGTNWGPSTPGASPVPALCRQPVAAVRRPVVLGRIGAGMPPVNRERLLARPVSTPLSELDQTLFEEMLPVWTRLLPEASPTVEEAFDDLGAWWCSATTSGPLP